MSRLRASLLSCSLLAAACSGETPPATDTSTSSTGFVFPTTNGTRGGTSGSGTSGAASGSTGGSATLATGSSGGTTNSASTSASTSNGTLGSGSTTGSNTTGSTTTTSSATATSSTSASSSTSSATSSTSSSTRSTSTAGSSSTSTSSSTGGTGTTGSSSTTSSSTSSSTSSGSTGSTGTHPSNDTCGGAIDLTLGVPVSGTLLDATGDYQAVTACTGYATTGPDVVYRFRASAAGTYRFSAVPTGAWDPAIWVNTVCPGVGSGTVTCRAGADTGGSGTTEVLTVAMAAGEQFIVFIDSYSSAVATNRLGQFRLTVEAVGGSSSSSTGTTSSSSTGSTGTTTTSSSSTTGSSGSTGTTGFPGDACPNALTLPLGSPVSGTLVGARNDYEFDDRACTGYDNDGPDVVFSFTPPTSGMYLFTASPGSSWDITAYVLDGCPDPQTFSSCIAGADENGSASQETFTANLVAGQPYAVVVDHYASGRTVGTFLLRVDAVGGGTGGSSGGTGGTGGTICDGNNGPRSFCGRDSDCCGSLRCNPDGICVGHCVIAGTAWVDGTVNPSNPCLICDTANDAAGWTPFNTDSDGLPVACDHPSATGALCFQGVCQANTCSLNGSRPVPFGAICPFGGGGRCLNDSRCQAGCFIDGNVFSNGQDDPTDSCRECRESSAPLRWSMSQNGTTCRGPNGAGTCFRGDCVPGGCVIASASWPAGTLNPANICEECNPVLSNSDWSAAHGELLNFGCPDDGIPTGMCDGRVCMPDCDFGDGPVQAFTSDVEGCMGCNPRLLATARSLLPDGATCFMGISGELGSCGSGVCYLR